jgi:8-amino-3,8-dideoxy-alpha-D-manno-octulosonate transaminase
MPGFELIGDEEIDAIKEIWTKSGGVIFAHGVDAKRNHIFRVRNFEKDAAKYFEAKHCQATCSGSAALLLALKALDVGPGDEVITQSFTFVATVEAIILAGATPIVVDVNDTLNMDPQSLKKAINKKTKAIIPVHMLGNPAELDEICAIASSHSIAVVEDNCEAVGAKYKGKRTGTWGDIGCQSLDYGKTITSGEGGFTLTDNPELHTFMRNYHDHGHLYMEGIPKGRDLGQGPGFNLRMSEMQGAVACAQLKKLDTVLLANRQNKNRLKESLSQLGDKIQFRRITSEDELSDTLMFFLSSKELTTKVVAQLAEQGIGTKNVPDANNWHFSPNWEWIWKDHPLYKDSFRTVWQTSMDWVERCIALPIMVLSPDSTIDEMAEKVVNTVKKVTS